mmetsp:Transcript_6430/g.14579  ORF Transcript_6430/g.14579 Transcript_6430/m.14579 type:complete len:103 (-) Transcript_6430:871-1179(-)
MFYLTMGTNATPALEWFRAWLRRNILHSSKRLRRVYGTTTQSLGRQERMGSGESNLVHRAWKPFVHSVGVPEIGEPVFRKYGKHVTEHRGSGGRMDGCCTVW